MSNVKEIFFTQYFYLFLENFIYTYILFWSIILFQLTPGPTNLSSPQLHMLSLSLALRIHLELTSLQLAALHP